MCKITESNIFDVSCDIYIYIYIYVCMHTFRYSDSYVNFHLPCCVPPSSMESFFFQKYLPRRFFMEEHFGENLWGGVMEGPLIKSYQDTGTKRHFPIICKSVNCKSFTQTCWDIHMKIKPSQELQKALPLS